jgi:hypothetical protein
VGGFQPTAALDFALTVAGAAPAFHRLPVTRTRFECAAKLPVRGGPVKEGRADQEGRVFMEAGLNPSARERPVDVVAGSLIV